MVRNKTGYYRGGPLSQQKAEQMLRYVVWPTGYRLDYRIVRSRDIKSRLLELLRRVRERRTHANVDRGGLIGLTEY
jgi:hypothetical protein